MTQQSTDLNAAMAGVGPSHKSWEQAHDEALQVVYAQAEQLGECTLIIAGLLEMRDPSREVTPQHRALVLRARRFIDPAATAENG